MPASRLHSQAMLDDMWFSDPTTHIFHNVLDQERQTDPRVVGVYRERLDASNLKLRFAAQALRDVLAVVQELEHGEFIYFDDANRLKAHFGLSAFLVFLRAALDTALGGYGAYFAGRKDIDSINEVLKKWPPAWIPGANQPAWGEMVAAYNSETFTWIQSLVGRDKGMSLRDLVVHKGIVSIDTVIDDTDRGCFVIEVNKEEMVPARPWLESTFDRVWRFILTLRDQIREAETAAPSSA